MLTRTTIILAKPQLEALAKARTETGLAMCTIVRLALNEWFERRDARKK